MPRPLCIFTTLSEPEPIVMLRRILRIVIGSMIIASDSIFLVTVVINSNRLINHMT